MPNSGQSLLSHFLIKSTDAAFLQQHQNLPPEPSLVGVQSGSLVQTGSLAERSRHPFVIQPDDIVRETLIGQPKVPPGDTTSSTRSRGIAGGRWQPAGSSSTDIGGNETNERRMPSSSWKPPPGESNNGGNERGDTSGGASSSLPGSSEEEMLKILRYLVWRQQLEDAHNKMVHEWRLLALAIDKVLFWVFLVITVISSLSFLVIIPIQRRGFGFGFG